MKVNEILLDSNLQETCQDYYVYEYPRRALSVDVVCFYCGRLLEEISSGFDECPQILTIKRNHEPFKGYWCLPGGFVEENETTEEAAKRELYEETGLHVEKIYLGGVHSNPKRDSRGVVSVSYFCVFTQKLQLKGDINNEISDIKWSSRISDLGFDHSDIVRTNYFKLREMFNASRSKY